LNGDRGRSIVEGKGDDGNRLWIDKDDALTRFGDIIDAGNYLNYIIAAPASLPINIPKNNILRPQNRN